MNSARSAAAVWIFALSVFLAAPRVASSEVPKLEPLPVNGFLPPTAQARKGAPPDGGGSPAPDRPARRGGEAGLILQFFQGMGDAWAQLFQGLRAPSASAPSGDTVFQWFKDRYRLVNFNVNGVLSRSQFQGGSSKPFEGGRIAGVFAPAFRLTEDATLVFIYNGSYNRTLQVFTEDEGPRQRNEEQRHELIALLALDFLNPFGSQFLQRITVSPSFFQTYVFTRQTAEEDWGNGIPFGGLSKFKGLYDYWDRGYGLEIKFVHKGAEGTQDTLTLLGQYYFRHYRNFISLARLLDPTSTEPKFEKDYDGVLFRAVFEHQNPRGVSFRASYTLLDRLFREDRADEDPLVFVGVIGRRRRDDTHTVDGRASMPLPFGFTGALGGAFIYNKSTSGFNDNVAPLPVVGFFTERYYNYITWRITPELHHSRRVRANLGRLDLGGILTLSAIYSFEDRRYRERKAKDPFGNLKNSKETDKLHIFNPRVTYQIHKSWAFFFEWRRTIARSNFEDERTFRYSYDINFFGIGFQYRFTP